MNNFNFWLILTIGIFLWIFAIFRIYSALAHDDAAWIMNNPSTAFCCGPKDCKPISEEELDLSSDSGITVKATGEIIPWGSLKESIDGRYWRCVLFDGRTRCLFKPPIGW